MGCGCCWDNNKQKKVIINDNCIGCGACAAICDKIFDFNEDEWKAFVKDDAELTNCECLDDAISACPVGAIEKK